MSGLMLDRVRQARLGDPVIGRAQARLANGESLAASWVPAYARAFAPDDVRRLIDFYRTPLGGRWVAALPAIREESLTAARDLSNEVAHRAIREVLGPLPQWRLKHPEKAGDGSGPSPGP